MTRLCGEDRNYLAIALILCTNQQSRTLIPPDTLSRAFCAVSAATLDIFHFVKTRNLPYSICDVRQRTRDCRVCAEYKPRFHSPAQAHLIKATQTFERLNVDFKDPLKSNNQNRYLYFLIVLFYLAITCWVVGGSTTGGDALTQKELAKFSS